MGETKSLCGRYVNSIPATSRMLVNDDKTHKESKTERAPNRGNEKEDPFWFIICPKRDLLLCLSSFVVLPDGELTLFVCVCVCVWPREQQQ